MYHNRYQMNRFSALEPARTFDILIPPTEVLMQVTVLHEVIKKRSQYRPRPTCSSLAPVYTFADETHFCLFVCPPFMGVM